MTALSFRRAQIARLQDIVRSLRDPSGGCPWDLQQTHASMTRHLVEEAHEVIDAIEDADDRALCEELGDVLFQVIFHAQLAQERGAFDLQQVFDGIADKMVERHPHVFGSQKVSGAESVIENWERRKQRKGKGVLEGVPRSMSALRRAQRLSAKAATVGFDWPDTSSVLQKLDEELGEFREALHEGDRAHIEEELGDILFCLVNLARKLDVQAEDALRYTNTKFERRFDYVERALAQRGSSPRESSLEEMDALWNEAKHNFRAASTDASEPS